MRLLAMLMAALAFVSCDGNYGGPRVVGGAFVPSNTTGVSIAPSTLTLVPAAASTCTAGQAFSAPLDLVIVPSDTLRSSVDHVTFRLIDGSNLGGPMVTVPRPELDRRFGSTVLLGPRTFGFQPVFDCGFQRPRFLLADVVVVTDGGTAMTMTASATIR